MRTNVRSHTRDREKLHHSFFLPSSRFLNTAPESHIKMSDTPTLFSKHSNLVESTPSSRHDDSKELLLPQEERWRDRQSLLDSHGYILRPRLRPGWIPSWKTNSLPIYDCEDSIPLPVSIYRLTNQITYLC